jgi:hypothetical protein
MNYWWELEQSSIHEAMSHFPVRISAVRKLTLEFVGISQQI